MVFLNLLSVRRRWWRGKEVFGIFPPFTKADEVIGVPHDCPFADKLASVTVFDADGFFHPAQRNVG
jgi:hypothetical protein